MEPENDIVRSSGEDPRQRALSDDLQETARGNEAREAEIYGGLLARTADHSMAAGIARSRMDEGEELEHRREVMLRLARRDLDGETLGQHEIAARQFADRVLEYIPGKTKVGDLFPVDEQPDADAAKEAGLPAVFKRPEKWLRVLKFAAMAGAAVFGTVGMASFYLKRSPVQILSSPVLLVLAAGMAAMLLVGTYMGPFIMWARAGTFAASDSESGHTKHAIRNGRLTTAAVIPIVSFVDAEMIVSLNAARDLVNPDHRMPFELVLAVALGFNALYVLGVSVFAYNDGYGAQAEAMIRSKKAGNAKAQRETARGLIETKLACDAMNAVNVNETVRRDLGREIGTATGENSAMAAAHGAAIPPAPDLSEEERTELGVRRKVETYAARRLRIFSGRRIVKAGSEDFGGAE